MESATLEKGPECFFFNFSLAPAIGCRSESNWKGLGWAYKVYRFGVRGENHKKEPPQNRTKDRAVSVIGL